MKAMFGAGCFWGVEAAFAKLVGVTLTLVGYTGGDFKDPTYKDVCSGKTGHAEVVYIEYDSKIISYDELLKIFWEIHDSTTVNRQGFDIGTQYRSAIYYFDETQKNIAIKSKEEYQKKVKNKVITEITESSTFYKAEDYHQKYVEKKGASCH